MNSQIAIISLGPSLDRSTNAQLLNKVRSALTDKKFLVLDALELNFLDSAGVGQLFAIVNLTVQNSGDIAIIGANPQIKALFTLVQLDRIAHICPDLVVAMELLRPSAPEFATHRTSPLQSSPGVAVG